MANTQQKRIKFSKGQVVPELIERSDMEFYDSSAQELTNVVSTVYGGVRNRRGTEYIADVYSKESDKIPEATVYIGGTKENLFNSGVYETSNIGLSRDLFYLDYGDIITEEVLSIKNVRLKEGLLFQSTQSNGSFTVEEEREYRIFMCAGGGGGSNSWGGRGGGIDCYVRLKPGTYSWAIGNGGAGAPAYVRNNDGVNGSPSKFSGPGVNITCNGGIRRRGRRNEGGGGNEGTVNRTFSSKNDVKRFTVGNPVQVSFIDNGVYGWGAGGVSQSNDEGAGYPGQRGGIKLGVGNIKVLVEYSTDNIEWKDGGTSIISTNGLDIVLDANKIDGGFRYIRAKILGDVNLDFNGNLRIDDIKLYQKDTPKAKMFPFVYNNSDRLLFVMTNERILIYQDSKVIQNLDAVGLKEGYFEDIKTAYKDDTIILTHPDLRTKIIKRIEGLWYYSDLDWQNIPYDLFGRETRTNHTIPIKPSVAEGAVTLTADSDIFDSSFVGQYIEGNGGRVRISNYESTKKVSGYTVVPFYTDDKINSWTKVGGYEPVWSEIRGYPRTCVFAQQRLWFGGSREKPSTLWSSRLGDYFNFKNAANFDNDAINVDLLTNNAIVNLVYSRGLHIFTTGEEMTASESSMTPDGITVTINTKMGSYKSLPPVVIDGNTVFVEKNGKSILRYVYNYSEASFISDNLSILSNLINKPVKMDAEINSSQDKGDFLFLVLDDGTMIVGCVVLSQNIFSLSKFSTNGKILDVCCVSDSTYLLVERGDGLYVEKLVDKPTDATRTYYLSGHEMGGLLDYNDMDVCVYNDNFMERRKVQSGYITLDRDCEETIYIGVPYDYVIESNPIMVNHKSQSIKKRIAKASVFCKGTNYITFNGQKKRGNDVYDFYSCTKYDRDVRFKLTGNFDKMEILSIVLNINYEG